MGLSLTTKKYMYMYILQVKKLIKDDNECLKSWIF